MRDPELTRRLWILGVGETALGLGFAGVVEARPSELVTLPPGLYQPLTNHLGHALESAGRFHSIPPDSPTDYVTPKTRPFEPLFFSPAEFAVILRLTELILGQGPEPGNNGRASVIEEVAEWIDLRVFSSAGTREAAAALDPSHRAVMVAYHETGTVREIETFDAQKVCRDGLAWLQDESRVRHKAEFLGIGENDQLEILGVISDERVNKSVEKTPGTRFFELIKSEVIRGFYTSQAGLKELDFKGNAFYARSPGCKQT
ncbi:MAG: gluconate 2-dehydrogenase subunit 3 family protein [Bryobacteraceae bacterium]